MSLFAELLLDNLTGLGHCWRSHALQSKSVSPEQRVGRRPPPLIALVLMATTTTARAERHQVCLDFELGPQLFDASPRQPSGDTCVGEMEGTPCDPGGGLDPWEECDGMGACVPEEPDFGEDFGRWEGDRPFVGMRWLFRVRDAASGEVVWGWAPLDDNGCTSMFEPDIDMEDVLIERMRWAVSPSGHSILGYECELADSDQMMTQGPDGECEALEQSVLVSLPVGSDSSDCGGGGNSVDHCTLHFVEELDLEPIDYNFWAVISADSRTNFNTPTEAYILQETDSLNNAGTSAGLHMGQHSCVRFKHNQWRSKFIAAHEYGHLAFFDIPNKQNSHPTDYLSGTPDIDYGPGGQHTNTSPEWNAAAAVEGFADAAALAAWNDMSEDDDVFLVDVYQSGSGGASPALILYSTATPVGCSSPGCTAGQSTERNWGMAVREFLRPPAPLAPLSTVAGMLTEVHGSMWHPNGMNNDFGDEFDGVMSSWLNGALYGEWADLADNYNLYEVTP